MTNRKELDGNFKFVSKTGIQVLITWIEYETEGGRDYDTGAGGGLTLLNKRAFVDGKRIDMDPSSIPGKGAWCSLMDEITEFCFSVIESESTIINLTQHLATPEQVAAGVVEPAEKQVVQRLLTFDSLPQYPDVAERAARLACIARDSGCKRAMIGGAPFLMSPLENHLLSVGITPVYAFSVRESTEEPDGAGGVRKVNVFRHSGFYKVPA